MSVSKYDNVGSEEHDKVAVITKSNKYQSYKRIRLQRQGIHQQNLENLTVYFLLVLSAET